MPCVDVAATLVEGVDYDLDPVGGRIRFKSSGTLGPTLASFKAAGGCGARVDFCFVPCNAETTAITEGVDYDLDLVNGRIRFKSTGVFGPTLEAFAARGGCGAKVDFCFDRRLKFTCPEVLKECLPCNDDPILNISAEGPDSDRFLFNFDVVLSPPLGIQFGAAGCQRFCYSDQSLFEAQLCAVLQAIECAVDTWREPPMDNAGPPHPPPLFGNQVQQCVLNCPDGTSFGGVVLAGRVVALSLAEANRIAFSLACQLARGLKICIVTAAALPSACSDTFYNQTLRALGGTPWIITFDNEPFAPACARLGDRFPYAWALIGGSLPSGLSLDECTGVVSGTPTTTGTFNFTVRAMDSIGSFQTKQFTLVIAAVSNASPLPNATSGTPYSVQLEITPAHTSADSWQLSSGSLPPGLSLSDAGVISGTPSGSPANYSFTAQGSAVISGSRVQCSKEFIIRTGSSVKVYWKFDSTAGFTLPDSTPTGLAITFGLGQVILVPGLIGNACEDNTPATLVTVAAAPALDNPNRGFTICGWFRIIPDLASQCQLWFAQFGGYGFFLRLNAGGTIEFGINGGESCALIYPGNFLWHFYRVWYDAADHSCHIQLDMGLQNLSFPEVLPDAAFNQFALGGPTTFGTNRFFDETGWWNRVLTDAEAASVYNLGVGNTYPNLP